MSTIIETIYEKGFLRPVKPLALPENSKVTVSIADEDEERPWRGLFVPEPAPSVAGIGAELLPLRSILPEIPSINLSWLVTE